MVIFQSSFSLTYCFEWLFYFFVTEKVKLGGKTPMLFGLAMAVAYCHKFGECSSYLTVRVLQYIVLLHSVAYSHYTTLCTQTNSQEQKNCKPTFFQERENFTGFARTSSQQIFLAVNQPLSYCCNGLDKAYVQKLIVANQFIYRKLRNSVITKIAVLQYSLVQNILTSQYFFNIDQLGTISREYSITCLP